MAQLIDGETYLDVGEATALLGVKKATLYAYVSRGVLPSYKQRVGRGRLYRQSDLAALLTVRASDQLPTGQPTPAPADDDRVLRDVQLPDAASWAGEH